MNFGSIVQRFTEGGLGNPTREARRNVEAVRNLLRERVGDDVADTIAISPIIVMINPRVKLNVADPEVPVVPLTDLRNAVRRIKDGARLSSEVQKKLARAVQWDSPDASVENQPSARSNSWQRTSK
jgi:hypothetical protein